MKFGHTYLEQLENGGFPQHWVESAISYRQLKKCIKRVQKELAELGLDASTLSQLLKEAENERLAEYSLLSPDEKQQTGQPFHPKLLIAVDEVTGEPLDAHLSPKTKEYLHRLAVAQQLTDIRITEIDTASSSLASDSPRRSSIDDGDSRSIDGNSSPRARRMIEVSLTSDTEFFATLQSELSGLAKLHAEEKAKLSNEVRGLGRAVTRVTDPERCSARKTDLAKWRQVFEMYLESNIFFATNELDRGRNKSAKAQALLLQFSDKLQQSGIVSSFKRKESVDALEQFLRLNMEILQSLAFQEMNDLAMQKILKKFDKRTALGVKTTFPAALKTSSMPQDIAKAICYQLSSELLPIVPQLDDYTCPVCFCVSWKPVRLRCQHIFCHRCLVILQRQNEGHCPLCRGDVVMEADSLSLDPSLMNFLKKYFPDEVKEKQKQNEIAAGVDLYGEAYADAKCCVM
ncbi:uncharacterized protein K452DRAFT_245276 [Aplosporella prunicola CBS 121167]|uniref:RING-type domain-containing protein n=1 Tax=Aplosporella prunicola CBS 121167 TaxID=1176127 RepID=A0A6A6BK68_9PEZI|nr:uncharacterized protein K452DRAFT_245276 [Aplosporella prunicola CBS 121167]KAF2144436.1 hypothetical protein K452DRAFT_245276 [Aplosporella prunicola CBS 121167]